MDTIRSGYGYEYSYILCIIGPIYYNDTNHEFLPRNPRILTANCYSSGYGYEYSYILCIIGPIYYNDTNREFLPQNPRILTANCYSSMSFPVSKRVDSDFLTLLLRELKPRLV